jgi:hypothetical protein
MSHEEHGLGLGLGVDREHRHTLEAADIDELLATKFASPDLKVIANRALTRVTHTPNRQARINRSPAISYDHLQSTKRNGSLNGDSYLCEDFQYISTCSIDHF